MFVYSCDDIDHESERARRTSVLSIRMLAPLIESQNISTYDSGDSESDSVSSLDDEESSSHVFDQKGKPPMQKVSENGFTDNFRVSTQLVKGSLKSRHS